MGLFTRNHLGKGVVCRLLRQCNFNTIAMRKTHYGGGGAGVSNLPKSDNVIIYKLPHI